MIFGQTAINGLEGAQGIFRSYPLGADLPFTDWDAEGRSLTSEMGTGRSGTRDAVLTADEKREVAACGAQS